MKLLVSVSGLAQPWPLQPLGSIPAAGRFSVSLPLNKINFEKHNFISVKIIGRIPVLHFLWTFILTLIHMITINS